jgi:hypothetical protein
MSPRGDVIYVTLSLWDGGDIGFMPLPCRRSRRLAVSQVADTQEENPFGNLRKGFRLDFAQLSANLPDIRARVGQIRCLFWHSEGGWWNRHSGPTADRSCSLTWRPWPGGCIGVTRLGSVQLENGGFSIWVRSRAVPGSKAREGRFPARSAGVDRLEKDSRPLVQSDRHGCASA